MLSLVLHLLLLGWLGEQILWNEEDGRPDPGQTPLTASLRAPPPSPPAPAAATTPAPTPSKARPAPAARKSTMPATPAPVLTAAAENTATPSLPAPITENMGGQAVAAAPEPITTAVPVPAPPTGLKEAEHKQANLPQYAVDPPPATQLHYQVQALRGGNQMQGSAEFNWQHDGRQYQLQGETRMLFFTLLSIRSSGEIDSAGLAPRLYQEKRWRRAETNTHFNRPRAEAPPHPTNGDTISFSASSATYPRHPGSQDRFSVLWQLAGIGRANPALFAPEQQLQLFVAGTRDAEIWQIKVLGNESLQFKGQTISSWHLQRLPRPGSYEQKLDIWLAPSEHWLPLRILYTEANGEYLHLLMDGVQAADPATPVPSSRFRSAEP